MADKNAALMKVKLVVEVLHNTDGEADYEELKPCCERIARHRGEGNWYEVLTDLLQAAETGDTIQTAFATYRLVVEVGA
jgi:hypothetical protein